MTDSVLSSASTLPALQNSLSIRPPAQQLYWLVVVTVGGQYAANTYQKGSRSSAVDERASRRSAGVAIALPGGGRQRSERKQHIVQHIDPSIMPSIAKAAMHERRA